MDKSRCDAREERGRNIADLVNGLNRQKVTGHLTRAGKPDFGALRRGTWHEEVERDYGL